jgi:hypothetical protein
MFRMQLVVALILCTSGCTHIALRDDTARTTNTLADLEFRQILDNVARFQDNPDSLPSFALASSGTVSILDTEGAGVSPTYSPTLTNAQQGGGALPILSLLFPFAASRALTENWSVTPITDADNLRRLRCAFRLLVLGEATPNYQFCTKQMKEFFAGEEAALAEYYPPRGWYCVGTRKDVPKNACYIGAHGHTYVWVTPEGMNDLSIFTMGALDLATGKLRTPQRTVVRTYKGKPTPDNLVETKITTTEDDDEALDAIRKGRTSPPRARLNETPLVNPGLFFLPKP